MLADICYLLEIAKRDDSTSYSTRHSKRFTEMVNIFRDLFISKKIIKEAAEATITANDWWWILTSRFTPIRLDMFGSWRYGYRSYKEKKKR